MPLYELTDSRIVEVKRTTFSHERVQERGDIQRLLRDQIEVVASGCLVLAEEFASWEDSRRRIDLLCLDKSASLVVLELKRSEDGGAMELQALRYAAMVSTMTFEQAAEAHGRYLQQRGQAGDGRQAILDFLGWEAPEDGQFAEEVKLVLVSADFSRELTTSVMWLNERELDIRCVQLRPYQHSGKVLLDVEQVLPLKQSEEYQVRVREKEREDRRVRTSSRDYTKYDVTIEGRMLSKLAKRHAAFAVIKHLCDKGHTPAQISEVVDWRSWNNMWTSVEGTLGEREFLDRAQRGEHLEDVRFDSTRRFTGDERLIHAGEKTYALTSQWGVGTDEALKLLLERFPESGIKVIESLES